MGKRIVFQSTEPRMYHFICHALLKLSVLFFLLLQAQGWDLISASPKLAIGDLTESRCTIYLLNKSDLNKARKRLGSRTIKTMP